MRNNIVLTDVQKSFAGQKVLQGVTCSFQPGSRTALMGPSGSGKTTLTRLLLGLEKPDGGEVAGLAGARFSCVFQEDRLAESFSALQNVALVLQNPHGAPLREAFSAVGLEKEDVAKQVSELSGGMRRRVALVRALLAESDFVILDEAFKGLDAPLRAKCLAYIESRLAGRTLLLVTHDEAEAAICENRLLLAK